MTMPRLSFPLTFVLLTLTILTVFTAMSKNVFAESGPANEVIDFTGWQEWRVPVDPDRVAQIAAMLDDRPQGIGFPIENRDFWDRLAKQTSSKKIITLAEADLERSIPEFSEELYLDYHEGSGRRDPYNNQYRKPILDTLNHLVIAECLENQGRFLPAIEKYLSVICEMRSWTDPWHDRDLVSFKKGIPQIALESSILADQLATSLFWLDGRLAPEIRERVAAELERRTFRSFEQSIQKNRDRLDWWITGTNNWNPVCLNGVVRAALTSIESKERRAFFIAAAEKSVRYFFKGFSPNGYCDEGVGYWSYGMRNYTLLAEAVYQATDGQVDWFHHSPAADIPNTPTVADIARYPERIQIVPGISPSFADCRLNISGDLYTLTLLRRRLGLPGKVFSAADVEKNQVGQASISLYQLIPIFANLPEVTAEAENADGLGVGENSSQQAQFDEKRSYYAAHGVLIARPGEAKSCRLAIAILGGHNAESHNHNDLGTYVLVCDGRTPLVDPGSEKYTRRTFSAQRYESQVINSFGHPVPRVAGKLQEQGRQAEAKIISTSLSEEEDRIEMDLTSGYHVKTLESLVRQFVYSRRDEGKVTITDTVAFSQPESFESALITFEPWEQLDANRLRIGQGEGSVEVTFTCDACPVQVTPTTIREDLAGRKNDEVTRLGLTLAQPVEKATLTVEIRPCVK